MLRGLKYLRGALSELPSATSLALSPPVPLQFLGPSQLLLSVSGPLPLSDNCHLFLSDSCPLSLSDSCPLSLPIFEQPVGANSWELQPWKSSSHRLEAVSPRLAPVSLQLAPTLSQTLGPRSGRIRGLFSRPYDGWREATVRSTAEAEVDIPNLMPESTVDHFSDAWPEATVRSTAKAEVDSSNLLSVSTVDHSSDAGAGPSAAAAQVLWFDEGVSSKEWEDGERENCRTVGELDGEMNVDLEREGEGKGEGEMEEGEDEREDRGTMKGRKGQRKKLYEQTDPTKPPLLLVIQPRLTPIGRLSVKLAEALRLADSLRGPTGGERELRKGEGRVGGGGGGQPGWEGEEGGLWQAGMEAGKGLPFVVVQVPERRGGYAATYFGEGTVNKVGVHLRAVEASGCSVDALFVNAKLSGIQQRSLEEAWGKPVLDRVAVIIKIFGMHARTREAKLQVELAALEVSSSRLVRMRGQRGTRGTFGGGSAEVVSARGRASARGQGFVGGAGETELNLQRRRILARRMQLQALLASVRRTRDLHRRGRRRAGECGRLKGDGGGHLPVVAVVGYTNAGKSSMVSALSRRITYCDDRLFATLDPQLCPVMLPSGRRVLLSDTVGFISDLPVELVEAFSATLEEVKEADLLLHVIDSSAADAMEQRRVVTQVLKVMGITDEFLATRTVEAWNKVDLIESEEPTVPRRCTAGSGQGGTSEHASNATKQSCGKDTWEGTWDFIEDPHSLVMTENVRVCTSVVKGQGLKSLLYFIDKKLADLHVEKSLWTNR